jgi:hypothetical protein
MVTIRVLDDQPKRTERIQDFFSIEHVIKTNLDLYQGKLV